MTAIRYTASTSFTVPTGVSIVYVSMVGGGEGGANPSPSGFVYGNNGTGGGAAIRVPFPCAAGNVISILVGAGGARNATGAGNSRGGAGTGSSISIGTRNIQANGGFYGNYDGTWSQSTFGFGNGGGASGSGGLVLYGRPFTNAGGGGNTWLGPGGAAGTNAAANTGGGGGGGFYNGSTYSANAGNGGSGCVIIEY